MPTFTVIVKTGSKQEIYDAFNPTAEGALADAKEKYSGLFSEITVNREQNGFLVVWAKEDGKDAE